MLTKKRGIFIVIFLLIAPSSAYFFINRFGTMPAVDFDVSMQSSLYKICLEQPYNKESYEFFKSYYIKNSPHKVKVQKEPLIPKKLHWIWLGSPLPEKYSAHIQSWIEKHPDWEYKIWTEADVDDFKLINKDLFDASPNYGEKSDIWRYEILERFGGVYIDIDQECLKPFDVLHHMYHFYVGLQSLDTTCVQIGISLIGAIPHHIILKQCVKHLRNNQDRREIIARTGPLFFTTICLAIMDKSSLCNIVFPASYFFPCGYNQKGQPRSLWIKPESYAVHHWAGSWLEPTSFVPRQ